MLPGGVDPHCHIQQLSGGGLMNADTFETATRSAAFGGTTTVISFAAQHRGDSLRNVVEKYAGLAAAGAIWTMPSISGFRIRRLRRWSRICHG